VRRHEHQRAASGDEQTRELEAAGNKIAAVAIGNKGLGFLNRVGVPVVAQVTQIGDTPHLEKLIRSRSCWKSSRRRSRRGLPVLHQVHQHDEAGASG
jgi:F0F1-type ATP synthase gamma subunit